MRRGGIGGALLILFLVPCSWSYTFLDLGMGSEMFRGSARCGGMGRVSLLGETGPLAVALNPALLAASDGLRVTASYRFTSVDEDWLLPVHDSFDAILGYETYSHNMDIYHNADIAASFGLGPQTDGLTFGFAYAPAYDFNYDFSQEVRDRSTQSEPADKVIANAFVEGEGAVRSLSFGLAQLFHDRLSVGLSLDYLFGDYDLEARLSDIDGSKLPCWDDPPAETSEHFRASDLSGVRYRVGATLTVNERVEFATALTTEAALDGEYTLETSEGLLGFLPLKAGKNETFELTYPASYAFGVSFRPRNELLTVIEANVKYTRWSDAENDALQGLALDDTYEWFVGIEHVFYNSRPLRFGFAYKPSPADEETAESAMTLGSGIDIQGFNLEFALSVGWREYREFAVFDDAIFCADCREFSDRVEETTVGGVISISRRF